MARPESPLKGEVIALMRELTATHGVKEGVRLARERYPEVPAGSWGRWRQEAVGNVTEQRETDATAVAALAEEVLAQIPVPEQLVPDVADRIPVMRKALDFWRLLESLERDAQLLREFALRKGADGETRVRVPFALRDSHRMRVDIIRLALQQAEVAHSVGRMANFNQAIIDAIGEESPECQRRIMVRLRQLQTEGEARGF